MALSTHLKKRVGNSFHFFLVLPDRLITSICTSSISSMAATGIPALMILDAAAAASRIVGKVTTATLVSCGITASLRVISVTNPSVPSEPTNRFVRLYPAEDFLSQHRQLSIKFIEGPSYRGRRRVLMTVPSARTTVKLITQSFIVP